MGFGYGHSQTTTHYQTARNEAGAITKKVFNNSGLAHAWAHCGQSFGQSGNGNFYFEGRALYSYGTHFLVGFRIPEAGDRHGGVVLLTKESHSVSTSGHQSDARGATRHLTAYDIPALTELRDVLPTGFAGVNGDGWQGKKIVAHVEKHILSYDGEAALFMLKLANPRATVALVARLTAKAEKAAIAAKAARAIRDHKQQIASGKRIIEARAGEGWKPALETMAAYTKRNGTTYDYDRYLKEVRAAHKAASKAGYNVRKAALWGIVKEITEEMKRALVAHKAASRNKWGRERAKEFRRYVARHATGTNPLNSYDLGQWIAAGEAVLTYAPGTSRLEPAMLATIATIKALALDVGRAETAAREEAQRAVNEARYAKDQEARIAWLAGKPGRAPYGMADMNGRALIRAVDVTREGDTITGGTLETSQGASVPLLEAIKVFRMVKLCRERGTGWKRNGARLPVGSFQVDEIEPTGSFKAGCHLFGWHEIERLSNALGLATIAPADTATHA